MASVRVYSPEWFESLLRLLRGFDDPAMTPSVWRCLFSHGWNRTEDGTREPSGYLLVEGETVVGFLGTIYSRRTIGGKTEKICHLTSWIVHDDFRNQSLELLFPIIGRRDVTLVDLTASPEAQQILQRVGFSLLENEVGLFFEDGRSEPGVEITEEPAEIAGHLVGLQGEEARIFEDHRTAKCRFVLLRLREQRSLIAYTAVVIEPPRFEYRRRERFKFFRRMEPSAGCRVAHVQYVSNPALFARSLGRLSERLGEISGTIGILTESRFLSGEDRSRFRWCRLPHRRLFRSKTLKPEQIDHLYSELVLLGVAGQRRVVDGVDAEAERLEAIRVKKLEETRAFDREIESVTEEIRELETQLNTRERVQRLRRAPLPGLGEMGDAFGRYERTGSAENFGSILMFHSVRSDKSKIGINRDLEVSPEFLDALLGHVKARGWDIVSLDEALLRLKDPGLKNRFLSITFDDGYLDNLENAYPVLKKHGVPFAIYVCTDFPDLKASLWWYMLEDLVRSKSELAVKIGGAERTYLLRTARQRAHAFWELRDAIISASGDDRKKLSDALFGQDFSAYTKSRVLSWKQIVKLSQDPLCTIGAHTVTHPSLGHIAEADMEWEIAESKRVLERRLGRSVKHFCYPYGSPANCGEREFRAVERAGYASATTTTMDILNSRSSRDRFALPRIPIRGRYEDLTLVDLLIGGLESGQMFQLEDYIRELQQRIFSIEQSGNSALLSFEEVVGL